MRGEQLLSISVRRIHATLKGGVHVHVQGRNDTLALCSCLLLRVSFKHDVNTKVVERIIKEVQANNPAFQAVHIRGRHITGK